MPLNDAEIGKDMMVIAVNGGKCLKKRLASMGILPGRPLKVVNTSGRGQLIVNINETTLALGHGMTKKIHVI